MIFEKVISFLRTIEEWPVRLGVRTPGFHPGSRGSNPLRAAIERLPILEVFFILGWVCEAGLIPWPGVGSMLFGNHSLFYIPYFLMLYSNKTLVLSRDLIF